MTQEAGIVTPYSMICLEIIYLFLETDGPKIFAEKFDDVEIVYKAWSVSGEATWLIVS